MNKDKLYKELKYSEFKILYLNHCDEFKFNYKNYEINLSYGKRGKFAFCITLYNKIVEVNEFNSPCEVLTNLKIEGKSLEQIWEELN